MKILFVLSNLAMNGGTRVVLEHANRLESRGHQVTLVWPSIPPHPVLQLADSNLRKAVTKYFSQYSVSNSSSWGKIEADLVQVPVLTPSLIERKVEDVDTVIATDPRKTPKVASALDYPDAAKYHFVQGYRRGFSGDEREGFLSRRLQRVIDENMQADIKKVVLSHYMEDILNERLDIDIAGVVFNGIDLEKFEYDDRIDDDTLRVLAPYRDDPRKGPDVAIRVFEQLRESHPSSVELAMYGPSGKPPDFVTFYDGIPDEELADLYVMSDIFLFPSRQETWCLPPMEAMASECAVVSTNVGAIDEYSIPDETIRFVDVDDVNQMVDEVSDLIESPAERCELAGAARNYMSEFTWKKATDRFEEAISR